MKRYQEYVRNSKLRPEDFADDRPTANAGDVVAYVTVVLAIILICAGVL